MNYFELHQKFSLDIFHKEVLKIAEAAKLYLGYSRHDRVNTNFAQIIVRDLSVQNIATLENEFDKSNLFPMFLVGDLEKGSGYVSKFIQAGYSIDKFDSYMVYDPDIPLPTLKKENQVVTITENNWADFLSVANTVFNDQKYQDLIRSLIFSDDRDHHNQSFVCYENDVPVSCGAVLISKKYSIAYFHDCATLPEYRGQGHQKSLIKRRIEYAKEFGCKYIYSCTSFGSTSFYNYLKMGFNFAEQNYVISKPVL